MRTYGGAIWVMDVTEEQDERNEYVPTLAGTRPDATGTPARRPLSD